MERSALLDEQEPRWRDRFNTLPIDPNDDYASLRNQRQTGGLCRLPEASPASGETPPASQTGAPIAPTQFDRLLPAIAEVLSGEVLSKLHEDIADARLSEGIQVDPAVITRCETLTREMTAHLALAKRLKVGTFLEDSGAVSLVVQSLITDRRVTCRIAPRGEAIRAIQIDEKMHARTGDVDLADENAARELAEWVITRP